MLELRPEELACETPEKLADAIQLREAEITSIDTQRLETSAAIGVTTDPTRKLGLKKKMGDLGEALSDVRAIIDRLRAAKRQAIANADLIARNGVPYGPIWPEMPGERPSRRVRARGVA
jgi:hypothetical protein